MFVLDYGYWHLCLYLAIVTSFDAKVQIVNCIIFFEQYTAFALNLTLNTVCTAAEWSGQRCDVNGTYNLSNVGLIPSPVEGRHCVA